MIPIFELNQKTQKYKVPPETIEKDYVISWILNCICNSDLKNNIVFYGGTAIKRIYFEEHRFSEDIDLKSPDFFNLEKLKNLLNLDFAKKNANLSLEIDTTKTYQEKDRIILFITYSGYEEITGATKEIKVDLLMNSKIAGEIIKKPIIASYSDLTNVRSTSINVVSANTILANKISMLFDLSRNEPRDIFDIWFLLNRADKFDFNIKKIKDFFHEHWGFHLTLNNLNSELDKESIKLKWKNRLSHQLSEVPNYNKVIKEIKMELEKHL